MLGMSPDWAEGTADGLGSLEVLRSPAAGLKYKSAMVSDRLDRVSEVLFEQLSQGSRSASEDAMPWSLLMNADGCLLTILLWRWATVTSAMIESLALATTVLIVWCVLLAGWSTTVI